MNKNLLLLEINECDFKFFEYGSKRYGYPNIKKFFLSKNTLDTYTNDNKEGYNLDPWVQSVSINTGKSSNKHKILKLGQRIEKNVNQYGYEIENSKRYLVSIKKLLEF